MEEVDEERRLREVGLQTARSIALARQRAEQELLAAREALEEEKRVLEILHDTGTKLGSNLELERIVQTVTDAATEVSGAAFGAFFYAATGADGEVFELYTLSGAPREAFEKLGRPRNTAIFGPTFRGERVIRRADVREDPDYGKMAPHHGMPAGHLPVRSYLAVPVVSRDGTVIGGLFFGHPERDVFTERAERLVIGIAAQAAVAIDNARLYEQARRDAQERARLLAAERRAREEVERANLVKDEFLATLSHELRTPLNAVLGWSEVLLDKAPPDAAVRHGLEAISRNARAQNRLIEDLLDMNRIVSGKLRLDVQPVDLAAAVEAAVEAVRPSAAAKSIRLRTVLDPVAGAVLGDPTRLQQVVWNLLSNAVKFTPKGGHVDVALARVDSQVEISVRDSGIGIAAEFLPHLFERFRQADPSPSRQQGGLGLGLSIVKSLVELHGGAVSAVSAGEGRGATFVVTLPVRPIQREAAREHLATDPRAGAPAVDVTLHGLRVLVVDDEPDAREVVRLVLERTGATVRTAGSADEALRTIAEDRPDVVVSDIGMPGKDGYQLLRELRAQPTEHGGRVPAVALTAFARSEDRTRAMLAGYQAHVVKPIEPRELVATVGSLAGRTGGQA